MTKAELEKKLYARKQELGDQVRWGEINPDFALEMMIVETLSYARGVLTDLSNDIGDERDAVLSEAAAALTVKI